MENHGDLNMIFLDFEARKFVLFYGAYNVEQSEFQACEVVTHADVDGAMARVRRLFEAPTYRVVYLWE